MQAPPVLLDTTLRDGEQQPGLYFSLARKRRLARALAEWGLEWIEAGVPAMGGAERDIFDPAFAAQLQPARLIAWNRLKPGDLTASLAAGARNLHVSLPASRILCQAKLGRTPESLLQDLQSWMRAAWDGGAETLSVGAEDAGRADDGFLKELFACAAEAGALRVRFADTLGLIAPTEVSRRIGPLAAGLTLPLDFHAHNDFGLATANALAAWESGARVLSVTLLGLGERSGNAALDQVAPALACLYGCALPGSLAALGQLVEQASRLSGVSVPPASPHYGALAFTHESGIPIDGLAKDADSYEPFAPDLFGRRRRLVPGKHSGLRALQLWAAQQGAARDPQTLKALLAELREHLSLAEGEDPEAWWRRRLGLPPRKESLW